MPGPPPPPLALEYGRPAPRRRTAAGEYAFHAAVWLVVVCLIAGTLQFVVPRYESIYAGYKLRLPAATAVLISASGLLRRAYVWPFVALLPFAAALLTRPPANGDDARRARRRGYVTFLAGVLLALFSIFTMLALTMPAIAVGQAVK